MQTLMMISGPDSDAAVWTLNSEVDCLDRSLRGTAQRILGQPPETFVLAGVSKGGTVALEIMKIGPIEPFQTSASKTLASVINAGSTTGRNDRNMR